MQPATKKLTPAEIAARFDADAPARKARIARADERHAARMQARDRSTTPSSAALEIATRLIKSVDGRD